MDSLFVISEEPALAETLARELPDIRIEHVHFKEAAGRLEKEEFRLIILDEGSPANLLPDDGKNPVIRLTRPIALSELLYTIRERLQGKSAVSRENLALGHGFYLSSSERVLRSQDGNADVPLTEKETELLQCLLGAERQPVTREILLKKVWGYSDDIATHTLETHIYRLRGKLRQAHDALDILFLEEGGYLLQT